MEVTKSPRWGVENEEGGKKNLRFLESLFTSAHKYLLAAKNESE